MIPVTPARVSRMVEYRARALAWAERFRAEAEAMPINPPLGVDLIIWNAQRDALKAQAADLEAEAAAMRVQTERAE